MASRADQFLDARPSLKPVGITVAGCDYDRPPAALAAVRVPAGLVEMEHRAAEAAASGAGAEHGPTQSDPPIGDPDPQVGFAFDPAAHAPASRGRRPARGGQLASAGAWVLSILAHAAIVAGALVVVRLIRHHQPSPPAARIGDVAPGADAPTRQAAAAWWAFVTAPPPAGSDGLAATGGAVDEMTEPTPAEIPPVPPAAVQASAEARSVDQDVAEERIAPGASAVREAVPDRGRGGTSKPRPGDSSAGGDVR